MKKFMSMNIMFWSMLAVFMTVGVGDVFASTADLEVELRGRNNPFVYSPYQYRAKVRNNGTVHAQNVKVVVDFTETDTSPTKHILGRLTYTDSRCQEVNNKLECSIGRVKAGKGKNVKFTFVFPVSTKTIEMTASATTDTPESSTLNNNDTKTPNFRYLSNTISSADVINYHCTGQTLTAFYECGLFPSSTTSHPTRLESNGSVTFQVPGYTGTWNQPTSKELHFNYIATNSNTVVAEFKGYAVSASCFEGLTTFPPNSNYVSPYRVCIQ